MNLRTLLLTVGLVAAGCKSGRPESRPPPEPSTSAAALAEATFDVQGMTCASCNVAVQIAAERVDGVSGARASNRQARAWVTYDPARTTPSVIAAAISRAGYEAAPVASAP